VLGPPGIGKHSLVRQFLEQEVITKPTPPDWCYVNNFGQPYKPRALRLPPGQGIALRQEMSQLVEELRSTIPAVFDSEDYRTRKQGLEEEFKAREEKAFAELKQRAAEHGFAMMRTPAGLAFAPVQDDHVLTPEQFDQLSAAEQERITTELTELQEQLQTTIQQAPRWEREFRERLKALTREVTLLAVGHLMDELQEKYQPLPEVVNYLDAVQQDIVENVDDFRPAEESSPAAVLGIPMPGVAKDSSSAPSTPPACRFAPASTTRWVAASWSMSRPPGPTASSKTRRHWPTPSRPPRSCWPSAPSMVSPSAR
jgi:hypothetical protein